MALHIIGHKNPDTDSVCAAVAVADLKNSLGEKAVPHINGKVNPETKFVFDRFGVDIPEILDDCSGKDLILVDHTDVSQSIENVENSNIKMIIDHHKLGDITTTSPLEVFIKPVGSTCTIIKQLYDLYNVPISKKIAGIMLCAILSDTVIFKSPTTTEEDKKVAYKLSEISGVDDIKKLGMEMFRIKSAIDGVSAKELIMRDYKDFDMGGHKVGVGQLELIDISMVDKIRDDLYDELKKIKQDGKHSVFLLLTDIMKEGSELLHISDDDNIAEKAFGKVSDDKSVWLDGVMSRKKQIVPFLEKVFSGK